MSFRRICIWCLLISASAVVFAQAPEPSPPSSSSKHSSSTHAPKAATGASGLDSGIIADGVYRNKTLGLACAVPAGWVLRTEEMNAQENSSPQGSTEESHGVASGRVLLAAFSRPPEAKGEDVNASILIAAESVATYPGMTEAAQYFEPLIEVTKAQGFTMDEDPYDIAVGTTTLVRGDFHKDVGARVMRQSTLVILSHGYAVSITLIGGTDDEVEDLVDGLSFAGRK